MFAKTVFRTWLGIAFLIYTLSSGGALAAQQPRTLAPSPPRDAEYHIGAGDVIAIDVWKEPEITRTISVRPDGKISLPPLGDVQAAGLPAMQLAGVIRDGLTKYLTNPQVTVTITTIRTKPLAVPAPKFYTPPSPPSPPSPSPDLKQKCCVA